MSCQWMPLVFPGNTITYVEKLEALPEKKKPRDQFPFGVRDMDRLLVRLCKRMMWMDTTKLFSMLNGIYWFNHFLEQTKSLAPEQAAQNRDNCVRLFEYSYPMQGEPSFKGLAWKQFPRQH